jgi:magnesium transporter
VSVTAFAESEEAVRVIRRYDQVALPVLDSAGVLVGIVTVDDLLDVAEAEATEDFHRVGSVEPILTPMLETPISILYRRRIGWLLILVLMNLFTVSVLSRYENAFETITGLILFLPLMMGSAGNVGSQSATLMVRALATGDVRTSDWLQLLLREMGVAVALGLTMAVAAMVPGFVFARPDVVVVVVLTMIVVVIIGSAIGMSLPFLLNRLNLDPATASAPLVTSIADITGVLVYFSIATWYLLNG